MLQSQRKWVRDIVSGARSCNHACTRWWAMNLYLKSVVSIMSSGENLGPPHLSTLMRCLLTGLQGRIWEGKVDRR